MVESVEEGVLMSRQVVGEILMEGCGKRQKREGGREDEEKRKQQQDLARKVGEIMARSLTYQLAYLVNL